MSLTGITHDGRPTVREWVGLCMNLPEYWNRVKSVITTYQHRAHELSWREATEPAVTSDQYDRCVKVARTWQIKAQIIQPTVFAFVFWLMFDVVFPNLTQIGEYMWTAVNAYPIPLDVAAAPNLEPSLLQRPCSPTQ